MGIDIRLPQITGTSEKEQLTQIKSYLYQFASQLQWALQNIDTTNAAATVVTPTPKSLVSAKTQSEVDAQATFSSIKGLIIKSADIVNAYYDEISKKLEGVYVAESDFGTYVEQTSQEIAANSTSTAQIFENLQAIITGIDEDLQYSKENINENIQGVRDKVTGVNALLEDAKAQLNGNLSDLEAYVSEIQETIIGVTAYVKSGLLYTTDEGIPVYGLEIGQSVRDDVAGTEVFNKYARFTSEKLSFYDSNGNEVAYISDKKLYIRIAQITVAIQVGGIISLVMANGDVVDKWVGG